MAVSKEYWAREWLLRYVSMRHDTHQIDELIHIAQKAGYLSKNCRATKSGRHFIKISQEIDCEVRRSKQVGGVRTMRTSLRFALNPRSSRQATAATQQEQRYG